MTTHNGLLTITAEREARETGEGRSEFYYGTFSRTVSLPAGADPAKEPDWCAAGSKKGCRVFRP